MESDLSLRSALAVARMNAPVHVRPRKERDNMEEMGAAVS